jgi:YNFM family putative membrane transporter
MTRETHIQKGSRDYWRANLALFFAGFVTFSTIYMFQPLFPNLVEEFGISPTVASLSLSFATFSLALTLPISGSLSDVLGRRGMMAVAVVLAALLAVVSAFPLPYPLLLAIRLVQGMILAGVPAVAMAYLNDEIDPRAIGSAMGLYIAGNAFGGMAGRILTVIFADIWNWRIAIAAIGLLSLLLAVLFVALLPKSRNFEKRAANLFSLSTSLMGHLRHPGLLKLYFLAFLFMGCFVTLYNYVTFRLLRPEYGLSQTHVALIFLAYALGGFSSGVAGKLMDRHGRVPLLFSCLGIMLTGLLLTAFSQLILIIAGIIVVTVGFFGVHAVASSWVGVMAGQARAQASSLYLLFYYLGSSVSGTGGGFFFSTWGWSGVVWLGSGLIAIAVLLVTRLMLTGRQERSNRSAAGRPVPGSQKQCLPAPVVYVAKDCRRRHGAG